MSNARAKKAAAPAAADKAKPVKVLNATGKTHGRIMADLAMNGAVGHAAAVADFASATLGVLGHTDALVHEMRRLLGEVRSLGCSGKPPGV